MNTGIMIYECVFTAQVTSKLEYFMQTVTSTEQLIDTRLVHITSKFTELAKCQEYGDINETPL